MAKHIFAMYFIEAVQSPRFTDMCVNGRYMCNFNCMSSDSHNTLTCTFIYNICV